MRHTGGLMRHRQTAVPAELLGGGPADGERRFVAEGTTEIVVDTGGADDDVAAASHRYERGDDGRFRYAGAVDRAPGLPAPTHADAQAHLLAALGHDRGPHPAMFVLVVAVVGLVMFAFGATT